MSDEVKLEGKMAEFVDWIETISVLELSQLVKALEARLGVSAAAPVAAAAAAAAGGAAAVGGEDGIHRRTHSMPARTRSASSRKSAPSPAWASRKPRTSSKALPKNVKENAPKAEAEEIKKKLEAAGAKVTIK
jgi:large subunit ribosomal protein L7/L12